MSYSAEALRAIIRTATSLINLWSPEAEELLLGTAAKESHLGRWLVQINGPALGVCQVEPDTEYDNWYKYLRYRDELKALVTAATGLTYPDPARLQNDPVYNIIMARIWYKRRPGQLPSADNLPAMATYWDDHYNINDDHGFPHEFINLYNLLVASNGPPTCEF